MQLATLAAAFAMFVTPVMSAATNATANTVQTASSVNMATSKEIVLQTGGPVSLPAKLSPADSANQEIVANEVKAYYKDTPILAEIAFCESSYRQLDKDGNVFRGKVNNADVGVMQINEYYHSATAQKLGYDLSTFEGNIQYAKYLYEREGTTPWKSSKPCWSKYE